MTLQAIANSRGFKSANAMLRSITRRDRELGGEIAASKPRSPERRRLQTIREINSRELADFKRMK